MARPRLTSSEQGLWDTWKRAVELIRTEVARDIFAGTGLSAADHDVLSRLADLGKGKLRQHELALSLGWDKTRLTHQLRRMEERGLVRRSLVGPSHAEVRILRPGQEILEAARPVHAASVRERLLARIPAAERARFVAVLERIAE